MEELLACPVDGSEWLALKQVCEEKGDGPTNNETDEEPAGNVEPWLKLEKTSIEGQNRQLDKAKCEWVNKSDRPFNLHRNIELDLNDGKRTVQHLHVGLLWSSVLLPRTDAGQDVSAGHNY